MGGAKTMRRTIKCLLLVGGLGVLLLLSAAILWLRGCGAEDNISYFERVSGIKLPAGYFEVETAHPREFCLSGRLMIPKAEESVFLTRYGFSISSEFPLNSDLGIDPAWFVQRQGVYRCVGRSPHNRWELAYDPEAQRLFFVVLYPDMAGDPPS